MQCIWFYSMPRRSILAYSWQNLQTDGLTAANFVIYKWVLTQFKMQKNNL